MNWLFEHTCFMTRDHCGAGWTPALVFMSKLAEFLVASAYLFIPLGLIYLWFRRKAVIPSPWIIIMFASFILLCGITHICDIVVFYYPMYRLFIALSFLTGIVSLITAILLPGVIGSVLESTEGEVVKLSEEIQGYQSKIAHQEETIKLLQQQNEIMDGFLKNRGFQR